MNKSMTKMTAQGQTITLHLTSKTSGAPNTLASEDALRIAEALRKRGTAGVRSIDSKS